MSLHFKPIHPSRSPSLRVGSTLRPIALQTGIGLYSGLSVNCTNYSLEAMIDLEFPFGKFRSNTNVQFFVLEMACYTPELFSVTEDKGKISFVRKGVGFRIGVASWKVEMKAAANLAAVAASASLDAGENALIIQVFGGNAIKELDALRDVEKLGSITPESLRDLAIAGGKIADLLRSDPNLHPADLQSAELDATEQGPIAAAVSMQFATESIYRRKIFLDALDGAVRSAPAAEKPKLNIMIARAAYDEFGIRREVDKPDNDQYEMARKILFLGR
jgi:hypothetical protein